MRGASVWLSLLLLTVGCGASVTEIGGPDASSHDALPAMDASDALTVDADPFAAPRPIAPLSTATVTAQNPTLHWSLAPGSDGARIQLCHDRACTTVEQTLDATGSSVRVPTLLAPGVHFWHIAARVGTNVVTPYSPTWEFFVGHRSALVDSSSGTVPDFDGDGYADVFATAGNNVWVSFGTSAGVGGHPHVLVGPTVHTPGEHATVASAGDVNGDGFADIIVGYSNAVGMLLGGPDTREVGASMPIMLDTGGPVVGAAVSSAGDVNGDGYADVIYVSIEGAHVHLGGSGGLETSTRDVNFGSTFASAGDVNGDGLGDYIVGDPAGPGGGTARVHLGGAAWNTSASIALMGSGSDTQFGSNVAGAGDIDGDGYDDVVVSAQGSNFDVFLGTFSGPYIISIILSVAPYNIAHLASAGDVDGDGFDDIAIGASDLVFLNRGSRQGPTMTTPILEPAADDVIGAGDTNGDGYDDVIVGGSSNGTVQVYSGAANGLNVVPIILTNAADPSFGDSVASLLSPFATTPWRRGRRLHPGRFGPTMHRCAG